MANGFFVEDHELEKGKIYKMAFKKIFVKAVLRMFFQNTSSK